MLLQVGYVALTPQILVKLYHGALMSADEQSMIDRVPIVVEEILCKIPGLEGVREILGCLHKAYDGGGYPLDAAGEQIPWGARALKLAFDLDLLEAQGNSTGLAFDILRGRHGWYDPAMLKALSEQRGAVTKQLEIRELQLPDLRPGMILAQDVRTPQGLLLIGKGQKVTFTCSNASGTSPGASEL